MDNGAESKISESKKVLFPLLLLGNKVNKVAVPKQH